MRVHLLAFVAVVWIILITPGVDIALVTRNALRGGRATALATALGVNAGVATWVLIAALGLAAVVQESQTLFDAVRLAGAGYLIALGIKSLLASRRSHEPQPSATVSQAGGGHGAAFRQGLTTNLLNPKMAVLFTSLLPQFLGRGADPLASQRLLGAIFNALGLIWLTGFAVAVARSRRALSNPRVQRLRERLTGTVLIALGVRIALERR
jgi:threonine/homoserine/homoserine lactone efflux protein